MTAIVGIFDGTTAWIAAEGQVSGNNGRIYSRVERKLYVAGQWIAGLAGATFVGGEIERSKGLPQASSAYEFCAILRAELTAIGYQSAKDQDAGMPDMDAALVLARVGLPGIWYATSSLTACEVPLGRPVGVGSGGRFAEVAAWAALRHGASVKDAVVTGILASCEFDATCSGTVTLARVGAEKGEFCDAGAERSE